jgi:hypothetical protein
VKALGWLLKRLKGIGGSTSAIAALDTMMHKSLMLATNTVKHMASHVAR